MPINKSIERYKDFIEEQKKTWKIEIYIMFMKESNVTKLYLHINL